MGTQILSDRGTLSITSLLLLLKDQIPTDSSPGSSEAAQDLSADKEGTSPWRVSSSTALCLQNLENLGLEIKKKAPGFADCQRKQQIFEIRINQ